MVAFICNLRRGSELIGQGRGVASFSQFNRYVEKTIQTAASAALVDAIAKSTRLTDSLELEAATPSNVRAVSKTAIGEAYQANENNADDAATSKQIEYLKQLISTNIEDDSERERFIAHVDQLTKGEASLAIQRFANPR